MNGLVRRMYEAGAIAAAGGRPAVNVVYIGGVLAEVLEYVHGSDLDVLAGRERHYIQQGRQAGLLVLNGSEGGDGPINDLPDAGCVVYGYAMLAPDSSSSSSAAWCWVYTGSTINWPRRNAEHNAGKDGELPFYRLLAELGVQHSQLQGHVLEEVDMTAVPKAERRRVLLAAEEKWRKALRPLANVNAALSTTQHSQRQLLACAPVQRLEPVVFVPSFDGFGGE